MSQSPLLLHHHVFSFNNKYYKMNHYVIASFGCSEAQILFINGSDRDTGQRNQRIYLSIFLKLDTDYYSPWLYSQVVQRKYTISNLAKIRAEYTNLMWGNNKSLTEKKKKKKRRYTRTSRPKKGRKQTIQTYRYSEANLR